MRAIEWLGFAFGLLLVAATAASVLETTIVPRGTRTGLTPAVLRLVNLPIRLLASGIHNYERRDAMLAYASTIPSSSPCGLIPVVMPMLGGAGVGQ